MKKFKMADIWIFIISLVPLIETILFYNKLPEKIPMHWNIEGQVDRYGGKFEGAFLLPIMTVFLALLLYFIPKIDPKKENYKKFDLPYKGIIIALSVFMSVLHGVIIAVSLGKPLSVDVIIKVLMSLLFIFIGNVVPRFKKNYFAGFRTPWALDNEEVWEKTQIAGGRSFIFAGVVMLICSAIKGSISAAIFFTTIIAAVIFTFVYSYAVFKRITKDKKAD